MTHYTKRIPAVAGLFYPDNAQELREMVNQFLQTAKSSDHLPKAMIVPHAGYIYSGAIAASGYVRLLPARGRIQRVVLLGPSHRVAFQGLAVSSADYFVTPLGDITVDKQAIEEILQLPQVRVLDSAHLHEHSLEVHLPFLQTVLGDFKIVPLVVGEAAPQIVGEVLERLWGGDETVIIVSSDLSHFHDYKTARHFDALTSKAIEALRPENILHEQACGRNPINGLLYVARQRGMQVQTIDLRNSGDTAGSKERVVGYGTYVFN